MARGASIRRLRLALVLTCLLLAAVGGQVDGGHDKSVHERPEDLADKDAGFIVESETAPEKAGPGSNAIHATVVTPSDVPPAPQAELGSAPSPASMPSPPTASDVAEGVDDLPIHEVPTPDAAEPSQGSDASPDDGEVSPEESPSAQVDESLTFDEWKQLINEDEEIIEAAKASAILKPVKDTYLIAPCEADIELTIELCEHIIVQQVKLANYEMFSSMIKTLALYVAERSSPENWHKVAELQLADVRDLQTFAIDDVTIFAKFLKLEAIDHYGNEFYCPIKYETAQSPYCAVFFKGGQIVLQVFGVTMLEEFEYMVGDPDSGIEPAQPSVAINAAASHTPTNEEASTEDNTGGASATGDAVNKIGQFVAKALNVGHMLWGEKPNRPAASAPPALAAAPALSQMMQNHTLDASLNDPQQHFLWPICSPRANETLPPILDSALAGAETADNSEAQQTHHEAEQGGAGMADMDGMEAGERCEGACDGPRADSAHPAGAPARQAAADSSDTAESNKEDASTKPQEQVAPADDTHVSTQVPTAPTDSAAPTLGSGGAELMPAGHAEETGTPVSASNPEAQPLHHEGDSKDTPGSVDDHRASPEGVIRATLAHVEAEQAAIKNATSAEAAPTPASAPAPAPAPAPTPAPASAPAPAPTPTPASSAAGRSSEGHEKNNTQTGAPANKAGHGKLNSAGKAGANKAGGGVDEHGPHAQPQLKATSLSVKGSALAQLRTMINAVEKNLTMSSTYLNKLSQKALALDKNVSQMNQTLHAELQTLTGAVQNLHAQVETLVKVSERLVGVNYHTTFFYWMWPNFLVLLVQIGVALLFYWTLRRGNTVLLGLQQQQQQALGVDGRAPPWANVTFPDVSLLPEPVPFSPDRRGSGEAEPRRGRAPQNALYSTPGRGVMSPLSGRSRSGSPLPSPSLAPRRRSFLTGGAHET
ncbi:uncharacterized protein MONBRDRAFT_37385 [Monosiga brevicollis MX1]|uniref:SUN domain-containing protein n=1 Tax=Monosiga brevicollis TaxID=81824 RepID=A9V1D6_MONBE|nr:uncharacterized protein MONBRDRAFT_37385 [Monosiga brevicollis MX1]EDQ88548.1 predicted protein [Monosiga brevicollis MX1]|eukprot:XP_001746652.1 hypothetical protein [Monosiga brevicollis MX1]